MKAAARALAMVLAMIAGDAAADCPIRGRVSGDGLPLGGVTVVEMRHGAGPQSLAVTGADGGFSARVAPLAPDLQVLKVILRKPPFDEKVLLFGKDPATGCPNPGHRAVGLERPSSASNAAVPGAAVPGAAVSGAGAGSDACARPSVAGLTIYLAPYEIYGAPDDSLAASLNGDLPGIVFHRILAFQSRLGGVRPEDISVEPICRTLSAAHGEEIRRVGSALNALAVIAGDGELRTVDGGSPVVDLDSVFRVVPVWQDFGGTPLQIGDTIPAGRLRPSRVAERLTDLWGKQAVLAVALRRLADPHPPAAERAVRRLLIELRKTMTTDDPLLPDVQSLLGQLDRGSSP